MIGYEVWEKDRKERRALRKLLKRAGLFSSWVLTLFLTILLVVTAYALRLNNLGMLELRQEVIAADEFGDQEVLTRATSDLQRYVSTHMNTYMGELGIALQHSYDRDVARAVEESVARQQLNISPEVYARYDANCKPQLAAGEWHYVNCISSHIDYMGQNFDFSAPKLPAKELYYVNFTPPRVSLDFAGVMVMICLLLLLVIILRVTFNLLLRLVIKLKSHKKLAF
ncbi:hypothetical protein FWF93_02430 [Candidatus Saccharibacteria bacterium]|nr:hypothetical protein [Candidatus Saccharibacteria bacterium]